MQALSDEHAQVHVEQAVWHALYCPPTWLIGVHVYTSLVTSDYPIPLLSRKHRAPLKGLRTLSVCIAVSTFVAETLFMNTVCTAWYCSYTRVAYGKQGILASINAHGQQHLHE